MNIEQSVSQQQRQKIHWNCQSFMKKLQTSSIYPKIREMLMIWKQADRNNIVAVDTFMKLSRAVHQQARDQRLSELFNRCLIKEAMVPKILSTQQQPDNNNQIDIQGDIQESSSNSESGQQQLQSVHQNLNNQSSIIKRRKRKATPNNTEQFYQQQYRYLNRRIQGQGEEDDGNYKFENLMDKLGNHIKNSKYLEGGQVIQNMHDWVKKSHRNYVQSREPIVRFQKKQSILQNNPLTEQKPPQQLNPTTFQTHLSEHDLSTNIIKLLHLYLKCIVSLSEAKSIFLGWKLYQTDSSLYNYLLKSCEQIQQKRRKITIFAPLNELVDQKYPLEQVGSSYIIIPDGYANYSKNWATSELQKTVMNRKCVSVPLGSEVSFIINKKTDYQQQLFNYEDQRYQIDNTLQCIRVCIKIIKKAKQSQQNNSNTTVRLQSPMLRRLVSHLYPTIQNIYSIFVNNIQLTFQILLPRLTQKHQQLMAGRQRFMKLCEEVAQKNFYKSLDYRCYYFAKNDKKFNCPNRWLEQINLRKKQLINNQRQGTKQSQKEESPDQQTLRFPRNIPVNTFQHTTTQQLLDLQAVNLSAEDRKYQSQFPNFPDNQILFILNFQDTSILQDVLEILLYHTNSAKKKLLQLIIFRVMRTGINRRLRRGYYSTINTNNPIQANRTRNINNENSSRNQMLQQDHNSDSFDQSFGNNNTNNLNRNYGYDDNLLNQTPNFNYNKNRNIHNNGNNSGYTGIKDSQDQFLDFIDEENQPTYLENIDDNPFQGPNTGYTFLATKPIYLLMRYILTIYQRFLKAKQYSSTSPTATQQPSSQQYQSYPEPYKHFLSLLITKIKDKKHLQQSLRRLYHKNAFIFFTLDKFITAAAKIVNSIGNDTLTYKILKDNTKDYECGVYQWDTFRWMSVKQQIIRLSSISHTNAGGSVNNNNNSTGIGNWNANNNNNQGLNNNNNNGEYKGYQNNNISSLSNVDKEKNNILNIQNNNISNIDFSHNTNDNNNNNNVINNNGININTLNRKYSQIDPSNSNKDNDILFRFTYMNNQQNCYVSAWNTKLEGSVETQEISQKIRNTINKPIPTKYTNNEDGNDDNAHEMEQNQCLIKNQEEMFIMMEDIIVRGEAVLANKYRMSFAMEGQQPQPRKLVIKSKLEKQMEKVLLVHQRYI